MASMLPMCLSIRGVLRQKARLETASGTPPHAARGGASACAIRPQGDAARYDDHRLEASREPTTKTNEQRNATMASFITMFLNWLRSLFFKQEMELTLVGLQSSGKTTLVNVIANGQFTEDMIPTIGFNMRKVTKGAVVMKFWDLGGQARFRSMWERYCRGVNAIVFVVDAADHAKIPAARTELHSLLERPVLAGIPILVLGNKNDLPDALTVDDLMDQLSLKVIADREVACYSVSAKNSNNIDITLQWLTKHASSN